MSGITISTEFSLTNQDPSVSPNPEPIMSGGAQVICATGVLEQEVTLPAATLNQALAFPVGVTTAGILVIQPLGATDLIVKVSGVSFTVPVMQPFFLYGVAAAAVSVTSAAGGKILYTVGG